VGAENVVGAYLHLDETTPHIQAIVVPIDPQTSKLNASRWLDGRKALSDLQDRHARDMAPLGLERGIRGSLANHTEVRDWYGQMKAPLGSLPTPMVQTPGLMLTGGAREGWAEQETERLKGTLREPLSQLQTQARAYHHAADKRDEYEATAKQLAKELADTKAKLSEAKEELTRLRPIAELVRGLPLSTAASYFEDEELVEAGLHIGPDQAGRERVFDQKGKVVGRNAIDLVMLATKEDYAGAVTWLVGRGGAGAAQRAAVGFVVENANHVVERSMVTAVSPPVIEKRLTLAVERGRRQKIQGERGWSAHFKRHGFGMRYAKDTLTFIEVFSGLQIPATHGQVSLMSSVREELETDAKHRRNWSDRPRGPSR
jgi:Plasmid recombination enzyme